MIQLHWVIAWQIFTKPNIFLPYDPAVVLLDIHPKEVKTCVYTKTLMMMFMAALLQMAKP